MVSVARTRTTVRNDQIPEGDQWIFDSQFKQLSTTVPYGLSFLNSTSTLFIQQEASVGQSLSFLSIIIHKNFFSFLAITGLSSAQCFHVLDEQGLLVLYVAESQNCVL